MQDEVLTGEAVALDLQPLGFVARAVGAAIDAVLLALGYLGITLLTSWLLGQGVLDEETTRIANIAAVVLVAVAVPTAIETASRGRSLGKLVMGGRIVRTDGGAIGFRHAFIRALVGTVEILATLGSLALLVGIFTPRAQRLGDLVAGTYCERVRLPKVPPSQLAMPPEHARWATLADVRRMPDRLARKMWQFAYQAVSIAPASRVRIAQELLQDSAPYVHPMPGGEPVSAVFAIATLRRDRERQALQNRDRISAELLS